MLASDTELPKMVGTIPTSIVYDTVTQCIGERLSGAMRISQEPNNWLRSAQRLRRAPAACDPAIALYVDVAFLLEWLGHDIVTVAGPAYALRCLLHDFVTADLLDRVALCPHRLEPVHRMLKNGRQEFLAQARGRSVLLPEKPRI